MKDKRFIGFELRRISNVIKRHIEKIAADMGVEDMTMTHGWVIEYLLRNKEKDVFQKDFEERFSIRRSTATNILKLMEKNGLVTREPVPHDARLKKIVVTQKAVKMQKRMFAEVQRLEDVFFQDIPDEDIEVLFHVFERMRKNIAKEDEKIQNEEKK